MGVSRAVSLSAKRRGAAHAEPGPPQRQGLCGREGGTEGGGAARQDACPAPQPLRGRARRVEDLKPLGGSPTRTLGTPLVRQGSPCKLDKMPQEGTRGLNSQASLGRTLPPDLSLRAAAPRRQGSLWDAEALRHPYPMHPARLAPWPHLLFCPPGHCPGVSSSAFSYLLSTSFATPSTLHPAFTPPEANVPRALSLSFTPTLAKLGLLRLHPWSLYP